jgi:hypothetical protein
MRRRHDGPAMGKRFVGISVGVAMGWWVAVATGADLRGGGPAPAHPSLERRVMVGYQGWFRTPGDGAEMGWAHYRAPRTDTFAPGSLGIDFWPDVSELTDAERFDTAFRHADGRTAQVFSSHHPITVERHFRWMREHGIDGAFVQRFSAPIIGDTAASRNRLRATDNVLRYARAGAERSGRSFVVMYDLSGMPHGAMEKVAADWKHLVDDLQIRQSPAYQFHGGRPLVAVWGVGFSDGRAYTLEEVAGLIGFLKSDPRYGGNAVMLGIPTWWRDQIGDTVADPRLHDVLRTADLLSPWTPGRYQDLGAVRAHLERFWLPDRDWCDAHRIGYVPVVFPGFSWRNLKQVEGGIDRVDGRFLWEQYRQLANHGFTTIYQAMFDEIDEGTQIFKVTNDPPAGAQLLSYAPLPPDYYLRLVGQAGDFLRSARTVPERIPGFPDAPEIDRHLRRGDDAVYAAAEQSFQTLRAVGALAAAFAAQPAAWVSPAWRENTRVRATGKWDPRYTSSRDPAAALEWELPPPPGAGEFALSIRYPGDPQRTRATAARIRIYQADTLRAEAKVSLRDHTLRWHEVLRVRLDSGAPCRVVLDQETPSGGLAVFEPRLLPVR